MVECELISDIPESESVFDAGASRKFIYDLDHLVYPFQQPDGTHIGYSFPGEKTVKFVAGNKFFNFKTFANKKKEYSKCFAKLHFWNKPWSKQWVICVDFDSLTQDEYRQVRKWGVSLSTYKGNADDVFRKGCVPLAEQYQEKLGNNGFVFNSPKSGRPKILLLMEYPNPVKSPSTKDITALLEKLFPEHMAISGIDLSRTAFSTTFIDWEQKERFSDALRSISPILVETNTKEITFKTEESTFTATSDFKYFVRESLPESLESYSLTRGFNMFLRCICTMSGLARRGFGISQRLMAKTLGVCQATVYHYIKRAIAMGLLVVIDDLYIPEKRAKIYGASGALKKFLLSCVSQTTEKLPTKIKDGQWHGTLVRVATKLLRGQLERFIPWVKSMPGWDAGDRLYQAQAILKWLVSKHPELAPA